jgi:sugar phosphate isomerase/epimerase
MTTLGCPAWTIPQVFAEAARMGYEGVELRCLAGGLLTPALPAADRAEIRRQSAGTGLPVVAIGASSAFSHPDPAVRAAQEEDLRGMLQLAAEVGAPLVRAYGGGFPGPLTADAARTYGGSLPTGRAREEVCAGIAASLDRVASRAEELGLTIVVETHDGLSSAAVAADVLSRVRSPAVQALWDVLHPSRMGETPRQVWGLIGPRVRHVHFKDAARDAAGRWRATPLGEGEVPLRECLRLLRSEGYDGWLTLEWEKYWEPDIAEPEVALPRMLRTVRQWLETEA